jgi:hypothetical protein
MYVRVLLLMVSRSCAVRCVQPSTSYVLRVRVIDGEWSGPSAFRTTDNVCFDNKTSTQGGRVRLSNGDHSVVSSGGAAVAVSNVGFSRGLFTATFVIQVSGLLLSCQACLAC